MVVIITEPATTPGQWQMSDRSTFALPNEIYLNSVPQKQESPPLLGGSHAALRITFMQWTVPSWSAGRCGS